MSFCLHVPSSHSVLSLARTTARPLARTRTRTWFIGCPCALGFPCIATTHTGLVLSPSHVSIFLSPLRAHMHNCLPLSFSALPGGGRVCEALGITGNLLICTL